MDLDILNKKTVPNVLECIAFHSDGEKKETVTHSLATSSPSVVFHLGLGYEKSDEYGIKTRVNCDPDSYIKNDRLPAESEIAQNNEISEGLILSESSDDGTKMSLFFNDSDEDDTDGVTKYNKEGKISKPITNNLIKDQKKTFGDKKTVDMSPLKLEVKKRKICAIIDSDSEKNISESELEIIQDKSDIIEKIKTNVISADNNKKDNERKLFNTNSKFSSIIDSDCSEDGSHASSDNFSDKEDLQKKKIKKNDRISNSPKKKIQRTAAIDAINAIKSETQRLHRESNVNIPYHQPKSCTLKEFMSRKTIFHSNLNNFNLKKKFSLKMSEEELKDYAAYLEEREEEVQKLFTDVSEENSKKINITSKIDSGEDEVYQNNSFSVDKNDHNDNIDSKFENIERDPEMILLNPQNISPSKLVDDNFEFFGNLDNSVLGNRKIDPDNSEQKSAQKPKIQIISNIQISPAVEKKSTLNVGNLKRLIQEETALMNTSPKLSGNSKSIIDLDTGDLLPLKRMPSKADILLERYINSTNCKKKPIRSSPSHTLRAINNVETSDQIENQKEKRPGACYLELKENLKRLISEQRKTQLHRKLKYFKEEEEIIGKIFEEDDDDNVQTNNSDLENDDEVEDLDEIKQVCENFTDDQAIEDNDDEIVDYEDESDEITDADDELEENIEADERLPKKKKLKLRIVKPFTENDSSDEETFENLNFSLKYPLDETEVENPDLAKPFSQEINPIQKLCDDEHNRSVCDDELLELCSGNFEKTQQTSSMVKILTTQLKENELADLCSGSFTQTVKLNINNDDAGLSSDEEIFKRPLKTNKANINKICYSDDENPENNTENLNILSEHNIDENINKETLILETDEESQEDNPETFIDYDSEENEIQVKMTKTDINKKANEFFEDEAELSESEWGSADEDERNLDKYDIELGDQDEFDQDKLHDELGRIHMRKIMDEDAREVKKMQEMLFHDEENDGIGRERQFRWKKSENGFGIDDINDCDQDIVIHNDSNDDENEEQWRKMKHERENILKEKQLDKDMSPLKSNVINLIDQIKCKNINFTGMACKHISPNNTTENESLNCEAESESPFLISKATNKSIRGSFLKRDTEILSKVASITSHLTEFNGISTVQTNTGKNKNFVFAVLNSQKMEQPGKRKKIDIANVNSNPKKIKMVIDKDSKIRNSLIDHLN